jgi:hypothetical protein
MLAIIQMLMRGWPETQRVWILGRCWCVRGRSFWNNMLRLCFLPKDGITEHGLYGLWSYVSWSRDRIKVKSGSKQGSKRWRDCLEVTFSDQNCWEFQCPLWSFPKWRKFLEIVNRIKCIFLELKCWSKPKIDMHGFNNDIPQPNPLNLVKATTYNLAYLRLRWLAKNLELKPC